MSIFLSILKWFSFFNFKVVVNTELIKFLANPLRSESNSNSTFINVISPHDVRRLLIKLKTQQGKAELHGGWRGWIWTRVWKGEKSESSSMTTAWKCNEIIPILLQGKRFSFAKTSPGIAWRVNRQFGNTAQSWQEANWFSQQQSFHHLIKCNEKLKPAIMASLKTNMKALYSFVACN
jgi:hypothetical protein